MAGQLYSFSKIFHFPQKLADLQAGRLTPPLHVRLKPTNRCNHRCDYCCYRNPDLPLSEQMRERDEIPPEKMREIIGDLGRLGVRAVTFSGGGEPLCYPHIEPAIRSLADAGLKVAMLTNGSLLSGPAAEALARRATWVRVSVDAADRDSYARIRQVAPDEFGRVCRNLRDFARLPGRTCHLGVNFIVTRENGPRVLDFLRLAKELGAQHVKLSAAVVSASASGNEEYMRPFFDSVKARIAQGQAELADETFAITDKVHDPPRSPEGFRRGYRRCVFSQCLTVIAADQNVYTCQDKAYTAAGRIGSIRDRSFADLWLGGEAARRLAELDPSRHCLHHCVADAKNEMLLEYLQCDPEHLPFV